MIHTYKHPDEPTFAQRELRRGASLEECPPDLEDELACRVATGASYDEVSRLYGITPPQAQCWMRQAPVRKKAGEIRKIMGHEIRGQILENLREGFSLIRRVIVGEPGLLESKGLAKRINAAKFAVSVGMVHFQNMERAHALMKGQQASGHPIEVDHHAQVLANLPPDVRLQIVRTEQKITLESKNDALKEAEVLVATPALEEPA